MVAGLTAPVVNRLGKSQLMVNEDYTSYLVAAIALGIMTGALLAGLVFKRLTPKVQVTVGLLGMISALVALGGWIQGGAHLWGYTGCFVSLIVLGRLPPSTRFHFKSLFTRKTTGRSKGKAHRHDEPS